MLSKKATKYLRFLSRKTEFRSYMELEKDYKNFDEQQFWSIYNSGFLDCHPDCELPESPSLRHKFLIENIQFRINDMGKAYLEGRSSQWLPELRKWIALLISVVALVVSIIALISG